MERCNFMFHWVFFLLRYSNDQVKKKNLKAHAQYIWNSANRQEYMNKLKEKSANHFKILQLKKYFPGSVNNMDEEDEGNLNLVYAK